MWELETRSPVGESSEKKLTKVCLKAASGSRARRRTCRVLHIVEYYNWDYRKREKDPRLDHHLSLTVLVSELMRYRLLLSRGGEVKRSCEKQRVRSQKTTLEVTGRSQQRTALTHLSGCRRGETRSAHRNDRTV